MMDRRLAATLWIAAIAVFLTLLAANLFFGELNQDEGWYLYAGRLVAQGQLPFVDFATTQGPVMSFAYALATPLVARWGLLGGRLFTALLGIAGCLLTALLAARLVPKDRRAAAAFAAFALVAVNVHQTYFLAIVKTYALAALLLVVGLLLLTLADRSPRGNAACLASGVLLTLSAATRSSVAVLLPVVFLFLVWRAWRGATGAPRAWLWFAVGAGVTGLGVFGPFVAAAPRSLWFGLVEYHAGRRPGGWGAVLAYKAGFISRLVGAYFVAAAAGLALLMRRRAGGANGGGEGVAPAPAGFDRLLWAGAAVLSLVHFAAPFPYDDYQVIVYPLAAAALGAALARQAEGARAARLCLFLLLLCVGAAFSSPRNQDWFVAGRDRVWWPLRQETPLQQLQRAARKVRALAPPGSVLLTQDAYLAVEAGMRIPRGLELGPFSYFPGLTREEAEARHVLNEPLLTALLNTCDAPVAALSDWDFAIRLPSVTPVDEATRRQFLDAVERRYAPVAVLPRFGQGETRLRLLRLRE